MDFDKKLISDNFYVDASWIVTQYLDNKPSLPTRDHTMNTKFGSFLATDVMLPVEKGNLKMRLGSEVLTSEGKFDCSISFYLYFHSGSTNTFRVKTREAVGGNEKEIFNQTEMIDYNYWIKKYIGLEEGMEKFQLIMELEIKENTTSTVFIDDISISPECHTDETTLPTVTPAPETTSDPCYFRCGDECLEQKQVCNFHQECENNEDEKQCGQCWFEGGTCGWVDDSNGNFAWERTRPDDMTDTGATYPQTDHTNATDKFYMLAMTKEDGSPGNAKLVSPLIGETASTCKIKYWYSFIKSGYQLSLVILQDGETLDEIMMPDEGDVWSHGTTSLDIVGSYYVSGFLL